MSVVKSSKGVIGILTGGGDVPGLNPAIRAVTIRARRDGYSVVGIRRGWAGLVDLDRDAEDTGEHYQVLTQEVVNKAGRTGGTFLHSSRTHPGKVKKADVPAHLQDRYTEEINDLTPEVLKNLEWLGIDYLIPIGGDDTLSYGVRLLSGGRQGGGDPQDDGQRRPGHRLLHRLLHLRHPDHRDDQPAAHLGRLARAVPGHRGLRPLRRLHRPAADHGRRRRPLRHPRAPLRASSS